MEPKHPRGIPYEEVKEEMLRDPATRAAYDALEPWFQRQVRRIERRLTKALHSKRQR